MSRGLKLVQFLFPVYLFCFFLWNSFDSSFYTPYSKIQQWHALYYIHLFSKYSVNTFFLESHNLQL